MKAEDKAYYKHSSGVRQKFDPCNKPRYFPASTWQHQHGIINIIMAASPDKITLLLSHLIIYNNALTSDKTDLLPAIIKQFPRKWLCSQCVVFSWNKRNSIFELCIGVSFYLCSNNDPCLGLPPQSCQHAIQRQDSKCLPSHSISHNEWKSQMKKTVSYSEVSTQSWPVLNRPLWPYPRRELVNIIDQRLLMRITSIDYI